MDDKAMPSKQLSTSLTNEIIIRMKAAQALVKYQYT